MNSLTLLDSFLSRSLSSTRPPSPPESPSSSGYRRRSRPHSTTPASRTPLGAPGRADYQGSLADNADGDDLEQSGTSSRAGQDDGDHRVPSRSASMPRRASDYALQTNRNRLKRSDRMALNLAMTSATSAVADESDTHSNDTTNDDQETVRRTRKHKGKSRKRSSDDETTSKHRHPKSYSEGQSESIRHPLRRADTSPTGHVDPSGVARWGSSLWGLSSWLESPSTSSSTSERSRRKRSSTKGSKDWEYPPGDRLDNDDTDSQTPSDQSSPSSSDARSNGTDEEGSSDDSESSSGSSSTSSSQSDSYPPESRAGMAERLLFANRIFTPFHHPALTASVPNLPSEIRVGSVGTAGLGGMEDVDTVDFEGGESESEEEVEGHHITHSGGTVTPPAPESVSIGTSDLSGSTAKQLQEITSSKMTPHGDHLPHARSNDEQHMEPEDYFGSSVFPKDLNEESHEAGARSSQDGSEDKDEQSQSDTETLVSHDGVVKSNDTDYNPESLANSSSRNDATLDYKDREGRPLTSRPGSTDSPSNDAPPPYEDARRNELTSADSKERTSPDRSSSTPLLPPADQHKQEKPHSDGRGIIRKVLAFLRRAILTLLLAPIEAVTFVFSVGSGKHRQTVEIRVDSAPCMKQPRPASQRRHGDGLDNEDDVVTEDQARARAERLEQRKKRGQLQPSQGTAGTADSEKQPSSEESQIEQQPSEKELITRKQSRLLPNPHPVDPMLVHEKNAKKISGELPVELVRDRDRGARLGLMDQKTGEALVGTMTEKQPRSQSGTPTGSVSPAPPGPRSAVIHHTPKILVLDLDETLIHSTSRSPTWTALRAQHSRTAAAKHAVSTGGSLLGLEGLGGLLGLTGASQGRSVRPHMVEVVLGGRSVIYHVYKRPWVDYFLRKVSAWYHVVVFTASVQEYADPVIDWLDQGRGLIAGRLFRDACTYKNGSYLKNLSIVDVDLSRVCLVDNSPASYYLNPSNGIPIEGWTHDPSDEALLDLLPVLDSLRFAQDVRHVLGLRITEKRNVM